MTLELTKADDRDRLGAAALAHRDLARRRAPSTAKGLTMAGVDYLRAMVDGDLRSRRSAG